MGEEDLGAWHNRVLITLIRSRSYGFSRIPAGKMPSTAAVEPQCCRLIGADATMAVPTAGPSKDFASGASIFRVHKFGNADRQEVQKPIEVYSEDAYDALSAPILKSSGQGCLYKR